jgi:hypothetical protein
MVNPAGKSLNEILRQRLASGIAVTIAFFVW